MEIETWSIERIIPYPKNARKIPQAAIDAVARSISEFGWRQPIVVDPAGVIVMGHVRRLAALKLGQWQVPVHVAHGLSAEQIRALRLMDNRSHDEAQWDPELLGVELKDLQALAVDLSSTGFNARELDGLLLTADERADDCPPVPEVAISRTGDLWLLGPHRVLCGDATSAADVERMLGGGKPFLMVTDPPYGVNYNPQWRNDAAEKGSIGYAARRVGKVTNDNRTDWSEAWSVFPGDVIYCWSPAGSNSIESANALLASGFEIRNQIIWRKTRFVISRGNYHYQHEPCWYAVRHAKRSNWSGDRAQSSVWDVAFDANIAGGHSTQKPAELFRRPILNHTAQHEPVYDPFLGSGTCVIAAENTERVCYGLEIEPLYIDVIVRRWQDFTGREATLDGDGRTFTEIAATRGDVGGQLAVQDALKEEAAGAVS